MKKIKTTLSSRSISETIRQLETIKKNLKDCEEEITKELVDSTVGWINENYTVISDVKGNKGKAIAQGSSVIYMEFGTGDMGLNGQEHPKRNDFALKDFNSGKTIKTVSNGLHYWKYDGVYTRGISAGLQVYRAAEKLNKEKLTLAKKVVDYKIW